MKESLSLQVSEKSKEEAIAYMEHAGEPYKLELIRELADDVTISFYKQGEYAEFCVGPHISNVCQIKALKLLSVAGAYWRGDEKNAMLTRIHGISFPKASQLEEYLHMLEEAKARDHRKPGKELGLVRRNEKSGTLHGLMRVRSFTQDDAHSKRPTGEMPGERGEVPSEAWNCIFNGDSMCSIQ